MGNGRPYTREEDATLRELAGKVPAADIAAMIGRPKGGVHHRISRLGLDGRLHGERHWNARCGALRAAMIGALHDAGFSIHEIHGVLAESQSLSLQTVSDIAAGRTWR